ncbi:hypothetical protein ACYCUO_08970 [Paenibacillus sp. SEL2]
MVVQVWIRHQKKAADQEEAPDLLLFADYFSQRMMLYDEYEV